MSMHTPADMLLQLEDIAEHCLEGEHRDFVRNLISQMHGGEVTVLNEHQLQTLCAIHRQHFV